MYGKKSNFILEPYTIGMFITIRSLLKHSKLGNEITKGTKISLGEKGPKIDKLHVLSDSKLTLSVLFNSITARLLETFSIKKPLIRFDKLRDIVTVLCSNKVSTLF
jgi:hypothetical protein